MPFRILFTTFKVRFWGLYQNLEQPNFVIINSFALYNYALSIMSPLKIVY